MWRRCCATIGSTRLRVTVAAVSALVACSALGMAAQWQNKLRAAMGVPEVGWRHWLAVVFGSAVVCGIVVGCALGIAAIVRWCGALPCLAVAGVVVVFGAPAVVDWRQAAYRTSSSALDIAVAQTFRRCTREVGFARDVAVVGRQGRKFVSAGSGDSVRVYVGIDSAPASMRVCNWRCGSSSAPAGWPRDNVVVAVPTGSGWIDANAVAGLERRFGDDVAVVGIQYSYAPSWATFVFGRDEAIAAATALYDAVAERIASKPVRPRLYVYGQSLGSVGGSAAAQHGGACGALWAGPPAGTAVGDAAVLANSSDPVVRWSPRLAVAPPDLSAVRADAGAALVAGGQLRADDRRPVRRPGNSCRPRPSLRDGSGYVDAELLTPVRG